MFHLLIVFYFFEKEILKCVSKIVALLTKNGKYGNKKSLTGFFVFIFVLK